MKIAQLVKSVDFKADPSEYKGTCPVGVQFTGSITVNRPGTVTYRHVSNQGRKSPQLKLEFDKAGAKATRRWHRTISKPDPGATVTMGGTGATWDYQGWQRIEILSPEPSSKKVSFKIDCQTAAETKPVRIKSN